MVGPCQVQLGEPRPIGSAPVVLSLPVMGAPGLEHDPVDLPNRAILVPDDQRPMMGEYPPFWWYPKPGQNELADSDLSSVSPLPDEDSGTAGLGWSVVVALNYGAIILSGKPQIARAGKGSADGDSSSVHSSVRPSSTSLAW